ncbi:MAG: hypothetical protein H7Y86_15780 [Rhizobacter sp.]|nr:hypothetical protein [Ferruginibacter sp.]
MKCINLTLWICTLLLLSACKNQGKFEITNSTGKLVDSFYIMPDKRSGNNFIKLNPGEKSLYKTDMSNESSDGTFMLHYKTKSGGRFSDFGYYTNGAFLEKIIRIDIQPDTVLFKFEYSKY